jgi:signal transduction histidine kinase/DNA-binding NarL/FixJ family response regulator
VRIDTEQFNTILSTIPDTGFILFDKKLDIKLFRDYDNCLQGIPSEKSQAGNLLDITKHPFRIALRELSIKVFKGSEERKELKLDTGYMKLTAVPLKDEKGQVLIGIIYFQKKSESIEAKVKSLTNEKEDAEESSRIKTDFIAKLSHEIRTPLNAMIGFIEQLNKTPLDEKQKNYLKIVDDSSVHLLDLVNEILTFSKIESGELHMDEVDFELESLISEIYDTFRIRANLKKINYRYYLDGQLKKIFRGDAFRLKQIIINLISNAIKFTDQGYVELHVSFIKNEYDHTWVEFKVSDSGIGIPENKIPDIFTQYMQANVGITKNHVGTGLGLTISKRLAELMNGRISVSSTQGKGSVFIVELPLLKSKAKSFTKDNIEIRREILSDYRVLIIDDDDMNRLLGKIILEDFDMQVDLAINGREALEQINKTQYHIILLDIHMPDMSGFEVARYIRHKKKDKNIKIIAVTADIVKEDISQYFKEGINDYLLKPYREIQLYNKICKVLDLKFERIILDKTEVRIQELKEVPLYNLNELRNVTSSNREFFHEMIRTFEQNATEGVKILKSSFKKKDWTQIRETAHKLIPSYKHLDIKTVVSDLVELKTRLFENPDPDIISKLIRNIDEVTGKVIKSMRNEKFED